MKRLLACVLLLLCGPALAQTTLPDTRAGKAFGAWLSALNAADRERMGEVIATYRITPPPPDAFMAFARQTGGFELLKVEESRENALTVIVAERGSDIIARGNLTVSADLAGQITETKLGLRGFPRTSEFAIPRMKQAEALKALEARARRLEKEDKFSGAWLIARQGKIISSGALGWEDREARRKATLQTKFRMGSMNKMFTAIATLQLVEAGKLALNGTVGQYLPDYPNKEIAAKVTIRHLLSHTGGTGDFFGPEFDANRLTLKTHADYMTLFGKRAPAFEPGSRFSYSNYGFLLLGNIIENVSGMSYYDYVARHIYAPAGMTSTGSLPEEQDVPKRATAYTWKENGWTSATLPYRGTAAGGGYTTVGDLLKFARALQAEKLLPGRLLADAATPHNNAGGYGYGFAVGGKEMLQSYGHSGGAPGINGDLQIYPALGTIIIALSNYDPPAATNLSNFYANRMPATR